jgi:hypothetical protein
MPKPSRRKIQSWSASAPRWENATIPSPCDFSNEEYHVDVDNHELNFIQKLTLFNIEDLAEMCRSKCSTKYLSVLLYMSLRYCKGLGLTKPSSLLRIEYAYTHTTTNPTSDQPYRRETRVYIYIDTHPGIRRTQKKRWCDRKDITSNTETISREERNNIISREKGKRKRREICGRRCL